ncbi:hypothetical protein pEaSNUABM11_00252 [Erwinia phage pEa_SNUABM_11]|nr:hypothetical protein pEaSNUABM11_00252 [Erwinia phage pEa_SNUABM_11]
MFNWLTRIIKNKAYKRRRSFLEAEYHKNTPNRLKRVLVGLELLTEPLEYNGDTFLPISLEGVVAVRTQTMDTLNNRLEFLFMEYNRVLASPSPNPEWSVLPGNLSKKLDTDDRKWLDEYFATSRDELARDKLRRALVLLLSFDENDNQSPERDVFLNQTGQILRELETIVEHYL